MLITLYKSVLSAAGLVASEEGLISMDFDGILTPCTIGRNPAKRLALPTPSILNNPTWDTIVAFHPMSESLLRGESEVLRKLKSMLMVRVLSVTSDLAIQLMAIAVNVEAQKKLSPSQHEYLSIIGAVGENTYKDLTKIMGSLTIEKGDQLINMYLKRAGQWKGKGYSRVAITTFPLLEELGTPGKEVFGHNLSSIKNKKAIKALFDFILPGNEDPDKYSYGTNGDVAPYFHAMMSSFSKVAKQLNSITSKFKKHLDDAESLMINVEYDKELNDLGKYRDLVPSLSGNEGKLLDKAGLEVPAHPEAKAVILNTTAGKQAVRNAMASIDEAEPEFIPEPQNTVALPWQTQPQQPVYQPQPVQQQLSQQQMFAQQFSQPLHLQPAGMNYQQQQYQQPMFPTGI